MPYINKSTLTLPATSAFPNGIWEDSRNPTSADFRNFQIGVTWINFQNKSVWFMVDKTATSGTWIQAAINATGILDLTGNSGGPVGADLSNNINILGSGTLSVAGTPGTNTLTISQNGTVATSYVEDAGSATPSLGILKISGGTGISTSGAGNTVTITGQGSIPLQFTEDSGTAVPLTNNLNVFGGTGITTSGVGHTVTIQLNGAVATQYPGNAGTAIPSVNVLNVLGSSGITTTGAGNTLTISPTGIIATTYTENSGTAAPSGNNLNILGASGITTSGAGSTVTISPGATIATLYTEDAGTAAPSGNNLNVKGGTGISTSGAGSTVTIATSGVVATEYDEDAGSAIPSLGKLKIVGGTGISTSGAGNTVTITNTSTSSLTFQEDSGTATPAAGVIMIRGGTAISTSGAGSTVTVKVNQPFQLPLQPVFIAHKSTITPNATGDGTVFKPIFDIVVVNQGGNYSGITGAFTAPVTGNYVFQYVGFSQTFTSSHTNGSYSLYVNGVAYISLFGANFFAMAAQPGANNFITAGGSVLIKLTAGDVVTPACIINGVSKTCGVGGGDFSGYLSF